jgi:hypothetical protein
MKKERSSKFWILFWGLSVVGLFVFYFILQLSNGGIKQVANILPIGEKYKSIAYFIEYLVKKDDQEKTFLILFQNNMEIRPGGGFIGSFGIVKIKNGKVGELQIHDTGNFDARIPNTIAPPYPMAEFLRIKSWKFRDSNFSPDWIVNANKAEEFYYLGQGQDKFDGVVGITTNVLTSFLKVTGPVKLEGYPDTYADENAVMALEYQVEKAYDQQGIAVGERKSVMKELAQEIIKKVFELNLQQKIELAKIIFEDLNRKDIQLYFKDATLQEQAGNAKWTGVVDTDWRADYLMLSDANLGGWKSDYSIKREVEYRVDLTKDVPKAFLKITYNHTAEKKDFMTKDYTGFLRVYVTNGAWMSNAVNAEKPVFGDELGKKYFGFNIKVPLGQTKVVEVEYDLPKEIAKNYDLKIQKQAGLNNIPVKININTFGGGNIQQDIVLNKDFVLSETE